MKRLDNKLKLSVSLLALMGSGMVLAAPAAAITISGAHNSVVIPTDAPDLTVDSTGDVTPGGILVQGAVAGDVLNSGSIEFLDSPIATETNSVTANAIGLELVGDVGGDITNDGVITGTANAGVSVIANYTDTVDIDESAPSSASATASGLQAGNVAGDISNTADIAATATADASSDLTVDGDAGAVLTGAGHSDATATGLTATLKGDFSNAADATIKADATASTAVTANVTGTTGSLFADDSVISSYADSTGVHLNGANSFDNAGSIEATSNATASLDGTLTTNGATGTIGGGEGYGLDVGSYSSGAVIWGEGGDITNSGSITGSATSTGTATGDVDNATGTGAIVGDNYVTANAEGLYAEDATGFSNTKTISGTAASSLSADSVASGKAGGSVDEYNFAGAEGYGAEIYTLDGDFDNAGTIAGSATANLDVISDAAATTTGTGGIASQNYTEALAFGALVDDFDGNFTNDADASITADATAKSSVDLSATGPASTAQAGNTTVAGAFGVTLSGGEGSGEDGVDTHTFSNAGTIAATATATSTNTVAATSALTDSTGQAGLADTTGALAVGVLDLGEATGFDNSGKITATATASATNTVTGTGTGTDAGDSQASSTNYVLAGAVGAGILQPVEGDVTNSGTITATATGTLDSALVSGTDTAPGQTTSAGIAAVGALGIYADIAPVVGEDSSETATYSFDNSNTITANGSLTMDLSQPAATATVTPSENSLGALIVAGAVVNGDPLEINNSGVITATGSLNVTGNIGEDSTTAAGVVGLWAPAANDGLVINNSGKITADLTGNAAQSASVGLLVGPLPDGLLEGVLGGEGVGNFLPEGIDLTGSGLQPLDSEIATAGVITINNTGTISGTNSSPGGLSYGIFAETAPVPLVINQMGGLISGGTAAIAMDQGNADTLNWSGGSISGLVDADASDVVNVIQAKDKDGKGVDTTVTAGTDFTLEGAGQLNIGGEDAPVAFVMNGLVTNVAETNLNTDGTLAVGPTGKIDTGTFNQADDSTLVIQFNPTQGGLITTTGDVNIAGGELQTQAMPGLYGDSGSQVVIDAGGAINGAWDTVGTVGDTLLIDFTTTVNPSDVVVSWERNAFDSVKGLSDNSKSVATALESGYDPTRTPSNNAIELNDQIGGLFTLTDASLYDRVLNSWSGSEHAQVMRAATNLSEPYLMALSEHLNDNRFGVKEQRVVMLVPNGSSNAITPASSAGASAEDAHGSFWARGFGRWASTRGDANADGFDEDTYGVVAGFDYKLSPNFLLGIVGSYISDDLDFDDGDTGSIDRWSVGGYASGTWDAFYIDGSFTYASDNYKVNRTLLIGGAGCLGYNCTTGAASKYDGDGWIAHAEAGFNWMLGDTAKLQPFVGLNFTDIDTDPFTETGGGDLGLDVLDGTGKSLQSRLGARLSGEWGSGEVKWVPELRAEWRHEFQDNPAWIQASLVGLPDEPFTTVGSHVSRDLAVIGAGISAQFQGGWGLYLDYQGAFASGYSSHIAQGGVRVRF